MLIELPADVNPPAPPPLAPMLVVEHVYKSFPVSPSLTKWLRAGGRIPRREVLHDIDFSVGRGELFGLLGPNGAGKTSLLKMLATLSIPDRGRIELAGIDVVRAPLAAKARVGLCPAEERSFYYRLSARANLEFFGALVGLGGRALRRRIDEVIELVDLGDALDRRFHTFSSGMRQRLIVARALLPDPDVLFLDEPTRAVDPVHAEALRRLVRDQLVGRAGKTVVLATNLLEEAWALCDRIAVIDEGRIVALAPPAVLSAELQRRLRYEVVLARCEPDLLARVRALRHVHACAPLPAGADEVRLEVELEPQPQALTMLLATLLVGGTEVRVLRAVEPEPMDVFRHLTGGETGTPAEERSR